MWLTRKSEGIVGSGNVFRDLGLNPEEFLAKAKLAARPSGLGQNVFLGSMTVWR
jgi:hypothetical protein